MSNINNQVSGIKYTGNVTIKVMKGHKVVKTLQLKNHGTKLLYTTVASALCGFSVQSTIPRYLDFGYTDSTTGWKTYLSSRVSVTGRVVENESIMLNSDTSTQFIGALFTGYIPSTSILTPSDMGNVDLQFSLFANYVGNDSQLAVLTLSDSDKESLRNITSDSGAYSLVVQWLMIFTDNENLPKVTGNDESEGE